MMNQCRRKSLLAAVLIAGAAALTATPAWAQTGACCHPLPAGDCTIETAVDCATAGGTYRGDDTTCDSCLGACCVGGTDCTRETEFSCNALTGTFGGYSTDCKSPCDCEVETFNFTDPTGQSLNGTYNGGEVNISGATLFVDFFEQPAITNDFNNPDHDFINLSGGCPPGSVPFKGFVDTNCNGVGDFVDQLAPNYTCGVPFVGHWLVNYRSVGSVEGFGEFIDFQLLGTIPTKIPSERGLLNRQRYANLGQQVSPLNLCIGDSDCDALFNDESGIPVIQHSVDISNTDSPSAWSSQGPTAPGSAAWNLKPTQFGYGQNTEGSHGVPPGSPPLGMPFSNELPTLTRGAFSLNLNSNPPITPPPDNDTIFDTVVAWSPVCAIANRGVGRESIKYTELQYAMVAGRLPNGENITACVRDVGSGTRNAFANSLNIDPSWCVGDHLGPRINVSAEARLGVVIDIPAANETLPIGHRTQPTNCGGSGVMEEAVQERRLAIGFTGYFGASRASEDTASGRYEMLSVCKDIDGDGDGQIDSDCSPNACTGGPANQPFSSFPAIPGCPDPADELTPANGGFVRPSVSTILDNDDPRCGYQIGSAQTFGTRGDPESGRGGNTNPVMVNLAARDYIRNISDSLLAFAGNPPGDENFNMPGEAIARRFMPTAAADGLPFNGDPTDIRSGANPGFVQTAQDYVRCNNTTRTYTFGSVNVAGLVPRRNDRSTPAGPGGTYSDGSVNGRYYGWNGSAFVINVIGNTHRLNVRNLVAGDFNDDGLRNIDDISDLMLALQDPRAFQVAEGVSAGTGGGVSGTPTFDDFVIPEVLGDFDGDGNFDSLDARYFADGLALDTATGKLDRKQGFIDVDDAWFGLTGNNNYFGTLAHTTGAAYKSGDSRGDVAGSADGPYRGAFPNGQDLHVDAKDIDYVYLNRGDWGFELDHAALTDLSCDMDGNLLVDQRDVDQIVHTILCTEYGDVNLDGDVNSTDSDILQGINPPAAFPRAGGWADGDLNGDLMVDNDDLAILNSHLGFDGPTCLSKRCGDIDGDNDCDSIDLALFTDVLLGNTVDLALVGRSDMNSDTLVNGNDIQRFVCCILNGGVDSSCP